MEYFQEFHWWYPIAAIALFIAFFGERRGGIVVKRLIAELEVIDNRFLDCEPEADCAIFKKDEPQRIKIEVEKLSIPVGDELDLYINGHLITSAEVKSNKKAKFDSWKSEDVYFPEIKQNDELVIKYKNNTVLKGNFHGKKENTRTAPTMSLRGVLLYMIMIGAVGISVFSNTGLQANLKLLGSGEFAFGIIDSCQSTLVSKGQGGNSRGRSSLSSLVTEYTTVARTTDGGEVLATGSWMFGEAWCTEHIGRKVPLLMANDGGKILLMSQYFLGTFHLVILALVTLLMFFKAKFAEYIINTSVLVTVACLLFEYYLW